MARKKAEVKTEEVKESMRKKTPAKKKTEQEEAAAEKKPRRKNAPPKEPEVEAVEAELVTAGDGKRGGVGGNGNLIPFGQRTKEEQRKICSAGGVASGKARRKKKAMREFLNEFLDQEATPILKNNMQKLGVIPEDMTNAAAMLISLFSKAVNYSDINAFRTLMEYAGRAPLQEMRENEAIAKMSQVMQLASGGTEDAGDVEDVVFYIPDNQRPIITDDDLVTVGEDAE